MKASRTLGIAILSVLVLSSCGGGAKKVGGFPKGKMPPGFTWNGKYYCDFFGQMNLTQTGSTVVGTVEYGEGRIEGTADGNILRFTWSQSAGPQGVGVAKTVSGQGVFQYLVEKKGTPPTQKDVHNIHGTWGYDAEFKGGGKWECYKSEKDVLKVMKTLIVGEEAAVAAADEEATATTPESDEPPEEGESTLKGVGAKKKKPPKQTVYEEKPPETGDERLDDLDL